MRPTAEQIDHALADLRADAVKARADEFLEQPDTRMETLSGLQFAHDVLDSLHAHLADLSPDDLHTCLKRAREVTESSHKLRRHMGSLLLGLPVPDEEPEVRT